MLRAMPRAAVAVPPHHPIIHGRPRHGATSPAYGLAFLFDAAPAPPANDIAPGQAPAVNTANPKWVQICAGGTYAGYRGGGRKFVMDQACFDTMIANLRRHPSYVAGTDALPAEQVAARVLSGELGVLPFDFDHGGGPAEAWALELQTRQSATGDLQLWAYTFFLEPAYSWMLEARYKWTSITWEENGTDPVSAEKVGPYVINVAMTNDPFVQGMSPIQCSRMPGGGVVFAYQVDPWTLPGDAVELVCAFRALFGLPEIAPLEDVLTALTNLRGWVEGTLAIPPGVVVRNLLRNLRRLLGLKPLDGPESIWAELDKLLGRLADEEETENVMPPPIAPTQNNEPSALTREVAARLNVWNRAAHPTAPPIPVEETVVSLEFARFGARVDEVFALIETLKKAFGTDDPKVLADKFAGLMAVEAQLGDLLPEAVGQAVADENAEEQAAGTDVNAALAAMSMNAELPQYQPLKEAMTLQRTGGVPAPDAPTKAQLLADPTLFTKFMNAMRARREKRAERRTAFRAKYGIDKVIQVPAHLQHVYGPSIFAGAGAAFNGSSGGPPPNQFGGQQQGYAPAQLPGAGAPPPAAPGALTWARVAQLPPSARGDNAGQRIYEELVRTELGGKEPRDQMARAQLWTRVRTLMNDLTAREGDGSNHFRAA